MKILRMVGYAVAFLVILLAVSYGLGYLLASLEMTWPALLERAVAVIVTWAIFWVAVWRPLGRRLEQRDGKHTGNRR